ncbi:MAG TPA: type II toxin-antitoxin system RelE/ParE family toxin [Blastocatellia bacterium]|nr:type II toxin-antitoxin system RelE/ParE family toxin [Blastocatellia bacterium]
MITGRIPEKRAQRLRYLIVWRRSPSEAHRLKSNPIVDADVEAAFQWYESEKEGLGYEFLDELRAAYRRIRDGPLKYQVLRSGIRRAMTRRFPYAIYFSVGEP